jgi:hypothetical protein
VMIDLVGQHCSMFANIDGVKHTLICTDRQTVHYFLEVRMDLRCLT